MERIARATAPAGARQWLIGLLMSFAVVTFAAAQEQVAIPALAQPVTDLAGALSPQQRSDLERVLFDPGC